MLNLPVIEAAGGLTIDNSDRVLFIFKNGRWDLPKGIVEKGKSTSQTALSEVSEETGQPLDTLTVVGELIPTSHISKYAKKKWLKRTQWFLIRCSNSNSPLEPQTAEGIEHCVWIPIWELERPLSNCPSRIQYLVSFWKKLRKIRSK
ncbi:NUDIX hydrolase [Pelagicoccus albus]|uniref:NUDIX domain-containing protein n=1 Tax=Pelagicoccus albus TaxID=415222 RepID=A0A7X1E9Q2_9BACT|nr:NUDIX domain-containing protein [Pelagicoccus albus]MBC2607669.1 NUDIX domain-containing protein [Pelagicoccus albus]